MSNIYSYNSKVGKAWIVALIDIYWDLLEPFWNLSVAYLNLFGTYWNLLGTYWNLLGTYWNVFGTYRNLFGTYWNLSQWLAPLTSSDNREIGGSILTVSTDDPLGWVSLTLCVGWEPPVHSAECRRNCTRGWNDELPIAAKSRTNKVWITLP